MVDSIQELVSKGEREAKKGQWEDSVQVLGEAIDALDQREQDDDEKRLLSKALRLRAFGVTRLGRFLEGVSQAKRAMDISASIRDVEGEADALRRLGYVHWRKGDYEMGLEFLDSAVEKAGMCGSKVIVGRSYIDKGSALSMLGRRAEAEKVFREAVRILEQMGDLYELCRAYNNLGTVLYQQKKYEEAIDNFRHCMLTAASINDVVHRGWGAMNIGGCYTRIGEPEKAKGFLKMALDWLSRTTDKLGLAYTHLEYGAAYTGTKEWARAEISLKKALDIVKELDLPPDVAEVHRFYGRLFVAKGDMDKARGHLEKARDIFKDLNMDEELKEMEELLKKA